MATYAAIQRKALRSLVILRFDEHRRGSETKRRVATGMIVGRTKDNECWILTSQPAILGHTRDVNGASGTIQRSHDARQVRDCLTVQWDNQERVGTLVGYGNPGSFFVVEGKVGNHTFGRDTLWALCFTKGFPYPVEEIPLCRRSFHNNDPVFLLGHRETTEMPNFLVQTDIRHATLCKRAPKVEEMPAIFMYWPHKDAPTEIWDVRERAQDFYVVQDLPRGRAHWQLHGGAAIDEFGRGTAVLDMAGNLIGVIFKELSREAAHSIMVPVDKIIADLEAAAIDLGAETN